jgi:hypothetical protein
MVLAHYWSLLFKPKICAIYAYNFLLWEKKRNRSLSLATSEKAIIAARTVEFIKAIISRTPQLKLKN